MAVLMALAYISTVTRLPKNSTLRFVKVFDPIGAGCAILAARHHGFGRQTTETTDFPYQ